ncbi:MAG TPA: hypothetical protein VLA04_04400 [Verrucomicrobiae bacterium]|nr:hypothetical protein [Verrucomicrobiae bacterium]
MKTRAVCLSLVFSISLLSAQAPEKDLTPEFTKLWEKAKPSPKADALIKGAVEIRTFAGPDGTRYWAAIINLKKAWIGEIKYLESTVFKGDENLKILYRQTIAETKTQKGMQFVPFPVPYAKTGVIRVQGVMYANPNVRTTKPLSFSLSEAKEIKVKFRPDGSIQAVG